MDDMNQYKNMSRAELLEAIFRLRAELVSKRAYSEGLEALIAAEGGTVIKGRPDGHTYGFGKLLTVVERRPYRNGQLTNEYRRNKKTGKLTGPYWQYRGVEDGKQINLYLGKTDDPEAKADAKLADSEG